MMRSLWIGAALAALLMPSASPAQQAAGHASRDSTCAAWAREVERQGPRALRSRQDRERGCGLGEAALIRLWGTVDPDTVHLSALGSLTGATGGAQLLRTVLGVASDRQRPAIVRVGALDAVRPYLRPGDVCGPSMLDTLREWHTLCAVDHPSYRASSSIEPFLRDTIHAVVRRVAREPGAAGRAAAGLMRHPQAAERWDPVEAAWCRRSAAAFAPAVRMSVRAVASDELRQLAECTESGPAALALAWRAAPADDSLLKELRRLSGRLRDRRVYRQLLAVARDRSRPVRVRVAAVDAIAPLLHPALYWFSTEDAASSPDGCSIWGFHHHEAVQDEGGQPMGAGSRREGVTELRRLAREVPPPVARAARTVARCAESALDTGAPEGW